MSLAVLLHDNHLLAVAKPAGVPCVADASGDESLQERAKAWLKREHDKPGEVYLAVVHRLDRPVSGVVLFARTSKAAARLSDQWRRRAVAKGYLGVVEGVIQDDAGQVEQWLLKDPERNRVRAVPAPAADGGAAQFARTRWQVRARRRGRTLLELEPLTGRSHQLRVACASLGHPLAGDLKYGASAPLADRSIALHACWLEFDHPTLRVAVRVEAPLPAGEPWGEFG
ncbi:MAG TPA: RluA family pseudouridine synthase [Planctomycetota bacterium]